MLVAIKPRREVKTSAGAQLFFSFADGTTPAKRNQPKPRKQTAIKTKPDVIGKQQTPNSREQSLGELALLLHNLAQKYVSRSNFQDFDTLVQCSKLLKDMSIELPLPPDMVAPVASYNPAVVTTAPQYRLMRSRAIAALATVADLAQKAPAKGSPEYQKGMRDGFNYASDIAIFFLDDLDSAFDFRSKPSRV